MYWEIKGDNAKNARLGMYLETSNLEESIFYKTFTECNSSFKKIHIELDKYIVYVWISRIKS